MLSHHITLHNGQTIPAIALGELSDFLVEDEMWVLVMAQELGSQNPMPVKSPAPWNMG
jgi:hypothetical protein